MAESSLARRQQLSAKLANARQTLALLKSQLKTGNVEKVYWAERLDDLASVFEALSEERSQGVQQERLVALYQVSKAIGSSLDLNAVLNQVMDAIIELTGAERGFLLLFGEDGELEVKAARNMERETLDEDEFAISRSVIRTVAQTGQQVVTTNAATDPRFAEQSSVVTHNLRSIQCVPLDARGKNIGVIYVDNRIRSGVFDESDLELLSTFATQAAMAIENARLFTLTDEALGIRVEELSMLQEIDRQLNETLDFHKVMALTLDWAVRVTKADNAAIAIIDLDVGETQVVAEHGEAPASARARLSSGKPLESTVGSITVPIQREGHVIGVIALERKGGRPFADEAQSFVMRLADHAAISIENAQLYEAVKRANDAKSEFVSVMAHELRVPMTSIKGYAEMLGMIGSLNEQQKGFLEIIRSNVMRMTVQVSDLSDVDRIESGRLKLEVEEHIKVRDVLDEAIKSVQAEIERRKHKVVVKIPGSMPEVRADPQRLNQIFLNLISNAYKYTPDGGTITITGGKSGKFAWCDVQDTGIGMTQEEAAKLFTKFWRSGDRYVREQPGTGLGLTIVKNLIELQGGELTVKSEKGVGTTFRFTMPISN